MPIGVELPDFFVKLDLEQSLLAAIAVRPETYWEVLDLLPPEAFTEGRKAFEELAEAIEQEKPLPKVEGEPATDPVAAAKELAGLYQKRLLANLAQDFRLSHQASELSPGTKTLGHLQGMSLAVSVIKLLS